MKWMLILLAVGGTSGPGVQAGISVGPYDEQAGCIAVGRLMEAKAYKWECVPIGLIPLKPAAKKEEAPADKKPEKKAKP